MNCLWTLYFLIANSYCLMHTMLAIRLIIKAVPMFPLLKFISIPKWFVYIKLPTEVSFQQLSQHLPNLNRPHHSHIIMVLLAMGSTAHVPRFNGHPRSVFTMTSHHPNTKMNFEWKRPSLLFIIYNDLRVIDVSHCSNCTNWTFMSKFKNTETQRVHVIYKTI